MEPTSTQTTIINRALQLLGYKAVSSINDNDRGARAMNRAYYPVLMAMLRENFWSFAIKRAILAASSTQPIFGKANYFPLPTDFVDLAMPDQFTNYNFGALPDAVIPSAPNSVVQYSDWQIEAMPDGTKAIASNTPAPLYLRYVSKGINESAFDPSFAEAFSARLATMTCEELTQSNTKLQTAATVYKEAMESAKQRNAFEMVPVRAPIDPYILVRM